MHITATIGKDEIVHILSELFPMKIDLGKKRSVSLGMPELIELAAGSGLRVRGDAKMVWEVAGMALPVTLRAWQILLVPSVVRREGALVLAFEPVIEHLDFKSVPGFFDDRIIDAINEGVASQRRKLSLSVSRLLGLRTPLPARVSPGGSFELTPVSASVQVTADELRAEVELEATINQEAVATPRSLRSA